MSLYHVFRAQTGVFAQSTTGWFNYFCNASGQLMCQPPVGNPYQVAASYATTGGRDAISTGLGLMTTVGNVGTGLFYGSTGDYRYPTFLGAPNYWISATGPQGQLLALPAYTRSS